MLSNLYLPKNYDQIHFNIFLNLQSLAEKTAYGVQIYSMHVHSLTLIVHTPGEKLLANIKLDMCIHTNRYFMDALHAVINQFHHLKLELSRAHTPCALQPLQHIAQPALKALQLVQSCSCIHSMTWPPLPAIQVEHAQSSHVSKWSGCGQLTTGMLNGKCTTCSASEPCSAIQSTQKPFFRRYLTNS